VGDPLNVLLSGAIRPAELQKSAYRTFEKLFQQKKLLVYPE
jgi:hypothetical protein